MKDVRVLSFDGGGIRGIFSATILDLIATQAGWNKSQLYNVFDIISGTSIGGIQALGYAKGLTPNYVKQLLIDNASTIFNCTYPIPGGGQASYGTWTAYVAGVYGSLYSQEPLAALISSNFGNDKISDYDCNVLIPAIQTKDSSGNAINLPAYFSNIPSSVVPYLTGESELTANVALATSAAPIYFPPAVFNSNTYIDGGVFLNDPSDMALACQRAMQPTANRFLVLSIGTGLGAIGYIPGATGALKTKNGFYDNLLAIKAVLDLSLNLSPAGIAVTQNIISDYTVGQDYFCRLNIQLDLTQYPDADMDNPDPAYLTYLQEAAQTCYSKNLDKITNFLGHFFA